MLVLQGGYMRLLIVVALMSAFLYAQENVKSDPSLVPAVRAAKSEIMIPSGTKIPIVLKNTISTKANHIGDPIYAESTFPVVINDKIVVPAGTYVQGKISAIKPAGRVKGHAEVLFHFTSLIYPSGYTVMLPGAIENAPGVDNAKVKDKEGTIQGDTGKGGKIAKVAIPTAEGGAAAGGIATGSRTGVAEGAGLGAAAGIAIGMLMHNNEVKIGPGTTLEVVLQRDVPVDAARIKRTVMAERE
jgi:hypothetical protein